MKILTRQAICILLRHPGRVPGMIDVGLRDFGTGFIFLNLIFHEEERDPGSSGALVLSM
jgi:hypothetical protein